MKKFCVHRPGIEPGSREWESRMITITPTVLYDLNRENGCILIIDFTQFCVKFTTSSLWLSRIERSQIKHNKYLHSMDNQKSRVGANSEAREARASRIFQIY